MKLREIFGPLAEERWYRPLLSIQPRDLPCDASTLSEPCDGGLGARAIADGVGIRQRILALDDDSPLRRRALGLWHLLWPDSESASAAAIRQLALAAEFSGEADAWNDLAAAHLIQGAREDRSLAWVHALRAADAALGLDPLHAAALHNRDLALAELRLPGKRTPLSELRPGAPAVTSVDLAVDTVSRLVRDPAACAQLTSETLAEGERRRSATGDRLLADLGAWLETSACPRTRPIAGTLAALGDLIAGIRRYDEHLDREGLPLFRRAAQSIAPTCPAATIARFYLAATLRRLNEHERARQTLEQLAAELVERDYSHLLVSVEWLLGTTVYFEGNLAASNAHYRRALDRALASDSRGAAAALAGLLSEGLAEAGRPEEAFDLAIVSIERARELGDSAVLATAYGEAASTALDLDDAELAGLYYGAAIPWAERANRTVELLRFLIWRSLTRGETGDLEAAEADLERAARLVAALPAGEERLRRAADLDLGKAHIHRRSQPSIAAALAERAAGYYSRHGPEPFYAWASVVGGEAQLALGNRGQAEERYRTALAAQGEFGADITEGELGFLRGYSGYDRLIELLLLKERDPFAALEVSERSRLFDGILRRAGAQLDLAAAAARLPAGRKIVAYHVLDSGRILGWVLSRRGVERRFTADGADVERLVGLAFPEASADGAAFRQVAGRLYDLLVRPADPALVPGDELVIVPDKILRSVPFAGLFDRATGAYLVERHAVVISPLVAGALAGGDRARAPFARPERSLIVANPAFSTEQYPRLPPLPYSELEAAAVAARLQAGARVLRAAAATLPALTANLEGVQLFHFAGHAIESPANPGRSALVLASTSAGEPGLLEANRVRGLPLSDLGLVVLSACATSVEPTGSGTPLGLVGAFLDAGVPVVLGTLAPLGDRYFTDFFSALYAKLGGTLSIVEALRAVQLFELRSQSPADGGPPLWAFVEIYIGPEDTPGNRGGKEPS